MHVKHKSGLNLPLLPYFVYTGQQRLSQVCTGSQTCLRLGCLYSKTCLKWPFSKRQRKKKIFKDNYCFMQVNSIAECALENSAILLTFTMLPFVIKIFVLSCFMWQIKTGFTVVAISTCSFVVLYSL